MTITANHTQPDATTLGLSLLTAEQLDTAQRLLDNGGWQFVTGWVSDDSDVLPRLITGMHNTPWGLVIDFAGNVSVIADGRYRPQTWTRADVLEAFPTAA